VVVSARNSTMRHLSYGRIILDRVAGFGVLHHAKAGERTHRIERREHMADDNVVADTSPSEQPNTFAGASGALRKAGLFAGRFRWVICGLLFLGVTKNYMDRQVLGVLKGPLQHEFGWNDVDYGNLVFAFQTAYAFGMIFMGQLIDRLGTRIGYAVAMVFWSLASMSHAMASSFATFAIARAALGFGEAGVFPASIKSVAESAAAERASEVPCGPMAKNRCNDSAAGPHAGRTPRCFRKSPLEIET
jgi:hypothetical protein